MLWAAIYCSAALVAAAASEPGSSPNARTSTYKHQRLRIVPRMRLVPPGTPISGSPDPWRLHPPFGGASWEATPSLPAPLPAGPDDWLIVRGNKAVVDELELAHLVGDGHLAVTLAAKRRARRLTWGIGFGAVAVTGVGTGSVLLLQHQRDLRTLGLSLFTVGIASAAVAFFYKSADSAHDLPVGEAQRLVDRYNAALRQELQLRDEDVAALP